MRRRALLFSSALLALMIGKGCLSYAAEETITLPKVDFPFAGITGRWDYAALQRGYQVYHEVCSNCHAMSLVSFRNLGGGAGMKGVAEGESPAGIGLSEAEVKALAAAYQVADGPNDEGEMFQRPGRPADPLPKPFANEQAARAANNGAYPPDMSLLAKAREGGPTYIHAIVTGYEDAPPEMKMADGMYYNKYFPGHQIAMPPPLSDDIVTYADGTKATIDQEAKDVASFLMWASEPTLQRRKHEGIEIVLYLIVLTGIFYAVKRRVWRDVH